MAKKLFCLFSKACLFLLFASMDLSIGSPGRLSAEYCAPLPDLPSNTRGDASEQQNSGADLSVRLPVLGHHVHQRIAGKFLFN
jgi:hypothetical protein